MGGSFCPYISGRLHPARGRVRAAARLQIRVDGGLHANVRHAGQHGSDSSRHALDQWRWRWRWRWVLLTIMLASQWLLSYGREPPVQRHLGRSHSRCSSSWTTDCGTGGCSCTSSPVRGPVRDTLPAPDLWERMVTSGRIHTPSRGPCGRSPGRRGLLCSTPPTRSWRPRTRSRPHPPRTSTERPHPEAGEAALLLHPDLGADPAPVRLPLRDGECARRLGRAPAEGVAGGSPWCATASRVGRSGPSWTACAPGTTPTSSPSRRSTPSWRWVTRPRAGRCWTRCACPDSPIWPTSWWRVTTTVPPTRCLGPCTRSTSAPPFVVCALRSPAWRSLGCVPRREVDAVSGRGSTPTKPREGACAPC